MGKTKKTEDVVSVTSLFEIYDPLDVKPEIANKLHEEGYTDLIQIAKTDPVELSKTLNISLKKAEEIINLAENNAEVSFETANESFKEKTNNKRYKTSSDVINHLLNGGVKEGEITEIYGSPQAGRSFFCSDLLVNYYKDNPDLKSVYLATGEVFNREVLENMTKSKKIKYEDLLNSILYKKVLDSKELKIVFKALLKKVRKEKKIKLIILNNVVQLFKSEFGYTINDQNQKRKNMAETMIQLQNLAAENICVIFVNDLAKPLKGNIKKGKHLITIESKKPEIQESSYSDLINRFVNCKLLINDCKDSTKIKALEVVKPRVHSTLAKAFFKITSNSLSNLNKGDVK